MNLGDSGRAVHTSLHIRQGWGHGGRGRQHLSFPHFQHSPQGPVLPAVIRGAGSQMKEADAQGQAGWAGSPELVRHDSPCFPGGAGTWGPCSVITQPGSPP